MIVGEIRGAGEETEVNIPEGWIRTGLELTPPAGRVADGSTEMGGDEYPEMVGEGLIAELEETRLLGRAGDWAGRLAAGSVGFKKMVEMTVIVTGPPAAGFIACGIPSEVEEEGLGVSVPGSTEEVEEGRLESVKKGLASGVEDGLTERVGEDESIKVAEGLIVREFPRLLLERVTLLPSNSASLGERSECP